MALKTPTFAHFDGTNQIRIVTLFNSKTITYDVEVKKASTLSKITLSAPSQVIAGNDGTVKIPFVAEDQFGNQLKKYSDLKDSLKLYPEYDPTKATNGGLELLQDLATKEAYIQLHVPENTSQFAVPYPIMASVTGTGQSSQITLSIQPDAYPESIAGLTSDVASTLAVDATTTIKADYIKVRDNYGRDKKLADLFGSGYTVEVVANDGDDDVAELSGNVINATNTDITVTAKAKGSERLKLTLKNGTQTIYEYSSFVITVVDNNAFESYEIGDLAKISNKADHAVEVKVYGKRSNGTKVLLPASAYSLTPADGLALTNDGKLDASGITDGFNNNERLARVFATIFATGEKLEKQVVVSNEALRIAKIELQDTNLIKKDGDSILKGAVANITVANLFNALKFKDQFDFDYNATATEVTVSILDLSDADDDGSLKVVQNGKGADTTQIIGVEKDDTFTVIFTAVGSGESIKVKVIAE
jgi:hypothetical protein